MRFLRLNHISLALYGINFKTASNITLRRRLLLLPATALAQHTHNSRQRASGFFAISFAHQTAFVVSRIVDLVFPPALFTILLLLRPQDVLDQHGADHAHKHRDPDENQDARHHAAQDLDGVAVERLRDGESRRDQRRVGEDVGVPRHGEPPAVVLDGRPVRKDRDEEKPQRQAPQPQAHPVGEDLGDSAGEFPVAHKILRHDFWKALAHADDPCYGEAGWSDGDEHAGSQAFLGKLLGHEAVDEGGVDHQGYHEADSLEYHSADDHLECFVGRQLGREHTRVRSNDEKRISREDPDGRHLGDCEGLRRPSVTALVLAEEGVGAREQKRTL